MQSVQTDLAGLLARTAQGDRAAFAAAGIMRHEPETNLADELQARRRGAGSRLGRTGAGGAGEQQKNEGQGAALHDGSPGRMNHR